MAEPSSDDPGAGTVSRETLTAPDPAVAAEVFPPARLGLLERYAGMLATDGVVRGLMGPREVPRLWDRHLINCGLLAPLIPEAATVADLGSGAGLPGLVLAIGRPDLQVTLVEPMARRVRFLDEACRRLELPHVEVVRGRAEEWADRRRFRVVTARALAPLGRLVDWAVPLLADDGVLLAMKGASAAAEIDDAGEQLRKWRVTAEVVTSSVPGASAATVVRVARRRAPGIG